MMNMLQLKANIFGDLPLSTESSLRLVPCIRSNKQQEMMMKKNKGIDLYTPGDTPLNSRAKPPHDNLCITAEKSRSISRTNARFAGDSNTEVEVNVCLQQNCFEMNRSPCNCSQLLDLMRIRSHEIEMKIEMRITARLCEHCWGILNPHHWGHPTRFVNPTDSGRGRALGSSSENFLTHYYTTGYLSLLGNPCCWYMSSQDLLDNGYSL
jgi:hypothetical protein